MGRAPACVGQAADQESPAPRVSHTQSFINGDRLDKLTPMSSSHETDAHLARPHRRPDRPQAVLDVIRSWNVTPHLRRVRLGGPGMANLRDNDSTDKYVKLLLPPPGTDLTPPYDLDAIRAENPEALPLRRTYTVRHWNHQENYIDIDFVLHPDADAVEGIAARWSLEARPGHKVAMNGAGGGYAPNPSTVTHLLVGDHASLPAIASALEAMPESAHGYVLIHLNDEADIIELEAPEEIDVQWIIGGAADLLQMVRMLPELPTAGLQVFCHAERSLTKSLRRELVQVRQIPRDQISISAYWAHGRVEDEFQAEKREAIGRIDD